jgi:hypothetical protein
VATNDSGDDLVFLKSFDVFAVVDVDAVPANGQDTLIPGAEGNGQKEEVR